jgi:hypothetical protein
MKSKIFVLLIAGMMFTGLTVYAHHSFTATYDEDGMVEIEGELVQFLFRNPHSWVHVLAEDESGEMVRYGVEWGGAGQLGGQGVTRASLRPGDHVIIRGNPGRNPADHRIRMRSLLRPSDGFGWGFEEGQDFD